ncbi:uracil-DNA glycosylase [Pseudohongiella sp. O18]|uniref:uracil-DNA glycosylase n=1 Tax=Pseudohongiella sp. O18 TaxID=2904248 RepID=UPI001EFFD5CE|nr:uracil-DNA glycosylase [Pseudohongiella sp. O18]
MTEQTRDIQLEPSWKDELAGEFDKPYMQSLRQFLLQEKQQGQQIFPPGNQIFNALNTTPFDKVRVVILGQDPYHGPDQAHGLCFSVQQDVAVPPSLQNIYKELHADLGLPVPSHGNLMQWAEQGVLLLNAVLTVRAGQANSHQGKGWEHFTDRIVELLNERREHLVFMLWGSYAQRKGAMIDRKRHLVLSSPHPSPLSAHRGFLGNRHFSKANQYLQQQQLASIDWQIR